MLEVVGMLYYLKLLNNINYIFININILFMNIKISQMITINKDSVQTIPKYQNQQLKKQRDEISS